MRHAAQCEAVKGPKDPEIRRTKLLAAELEFAE
jgi:hypothetical protein